MRNNLQANPLLFKVIVLITCFMLVMLYNKSQGGTTKSFATNKVSVNFKQNIERHEIIVSLKAKLENSVQLFIFNIDGKLVKELAISTQKNMIIKDLNEGTYIYDCFDKDTRLNAGTLLVHD